MTTEARASLLSLTLLLLLCPAGCSDAPVPDVAALDIPEGCNLFATSDSCSLPYPSRFSQRADPSSPTGVRLALDPARLPLRDGEVPLDVSEYNRADGASPLSPILVHFGADIDLTDLPTLQDLGRSLDESGAVAIFNADTGERVLFFAEMDRNLREGFDDRYAFILRPVEPLAMGARHIVAIRSSLRTTEGAPPASPPAFQALRDGKRTTHAGLEAVRGEFEGVFEFLGDHGFAREDLLLAWDFKVASEDYVLGSVLSMRAEALAEAGETGLPYAITEVTSDPNPNISRIVYGTFEVPTYLRADDTFDYDADHRPVRQAANRSYEFTMLIPKRAELGEPLPLVVLGHGIFGEGRKFLTEGSDAEAIQRLSEEFGAVAIATDWIGLSGKDIARVGLELGNNLDRIGIVTDQLQQSLVNHLVMTKLARGALQEDPQIKVTAGPLIDTTRTYYWGASLGGIQGSSFISISDVIARAAFGVPGAGWATMISRSIVFPPIRAFLEPHYPDPLDFLIGTTLVQARFDHTDPGNLSKLMFTRPLPDAPPGRRVILQEAIGDSQVPNMTSEILARAMGVKLLTPAHSEVFGLDAVTSPTTDSVLAHYRMEAWDQPYPPDGNVPPSEDNGVHHAMNFLPNVHQQIATLFFTGEVYQYCDGACDPD